MVDRQQSHTQDIFPSVVGHQEIKEHLQAALVHDTVSHAYLFEGMEGIGKRTLAREFAKALLCTQPLEGHGPCGRCVSCQTMASGNHPDVIYLNAGEKASISVETIREGLVQDISVMPYRSRFKVYIVEDAHRLTVQAQNAMLKTIEEPPGYGVILLLAANVQNFLPTILSRCVRLRFVPLSYSTIGQALTERYGVLPEKAAVCAAFSQGALGRALELAASEDFGALRQELCRFLVELPAKRESEILQFEAFFEQHKDQQEQIFELLLLWFRDLLVWRERQDDRWILNRDMQSAVADSAAIYSREELMTILSVIGDIQDKLKRNGNYSLAVDWLLLNMVRRTVH